MDSEYRLVDKRKVEPCWVVFECPECFGLFTANAYLGAVMHAQCPKFVEGKVSTPPIMLPVSIGEELNEQVRAYYTRDIPKEQLVRKELKY